MVDLFQAWATSPTINTIGEGRYNDLAVEFQKRLQEQVGANTIFDLRLPANAPSDEEIQHLTDKQVVEEIASRGFCPRPSGNGSAELKAEQLVENW